MSSLSSVVALSLLATLFAGCGGGKPDTPVQEFTVVGEVLRVDPVQRIATIRHKKIEGWMEAMTMDFPIRKDEPLDLIQAGQSIQAKVYVRGLTFEIGDARSHVTHP